MKRIIKSIYVLWFATSLQAQQLNWVREHPINGEGFHFGNVVSSDGSGNVYCCSLYRPMDGSPTSHGSYIRKYSSKGNLIWEIFKPLMVISGIATDSMGNSFVTGSYFKSFNLGCGALFESAYRPYFLGKLDPNGSCSWLKEFKKPPGAGEGPWISQIALDKSEKFFYFIGKSYSNSFDSISFSSTAHRDLLAKYDTAGNLIWIKTLVGQKYPTNIAVSEHYVAVTGSCYNDITEEGSNTSLTSDKLQNGYTALYDLDGNFKWLKFSVKGDSESNSVAIDPAGSVYVTGWFGYDCEIGDSSVTNSAYYDAYILKYDKFGNVVKRKVFQTPGFEEGRALLAVNNSVYFSMYFNNELVFNDTVVGRDGASSSLFAKLNTDLENDWLKVFSSSNMNPEVRQIVQRKGTLAVCGDYSGDVAIFDTTLYYPAQNGMYYKKPFVLSIDMGAMESKPVTEELGAGNLVIYPNPGNGVFTISCSLKNPERITFSVTNSLGESVCSESEDFPKGTFSKDFDLSSLPRGIYLLRLSVNGKAETRRIIIGQK